MEVGGSVSKWLLGKLVCHHFVFLFFFSLPLFFFHVRTACLNTCGDRNYLDRNSFRGGGEEVGAGLNHLFGHPPLLKVVPMDTIEKYISLQRKNEVPVDKEHNVSHTARANSDHPEPHSP